MRVLRPLALSLLTAVVAESACFKAPEDRDFGKSGAQNAGGGSNDASAGGSSDTGGAGGSKGGAADGGRGGATAGGASGANPGGDAQAPDAGRHCTADSDCDDHDTCSGVEKCVGSVCSAGTALANKTACKVPSAVDAGAAAGACFDGACLKKCTDTTDCDNKN